MWPEMRAGGQVEFGCFVPRAERKGPGWFVAACLSYLLLTPTGQPPQGVLYSLWWWPQAFGSLLLVASVF